MDKLGGFIADFSPTKQFYSEVDGAALNEEFVIRIYAPGEYNLLTNYGTILERKTEQEPEKKEVISLNQTPKYPVKRLISKTTSTPLISTESHDMVLTAPAQLQGIDLERPDLVGSLAIVYETFPVQVFKHSALTAPGDYILFAVDSKGCYQEIRFNLSDTSGQDSLQIEGYPVPAQVGFNAPYAKVIIYPASANPIVKTDIGTVTIDAPVSNRIDNESLSFSGTKASARFFIDAVVLPITGYFFDDNNNHVTPSFRVIDGNLVADQVIYGTCYLTYYSTGVVYDYAAQVVGTVTSLGTIYAFHHKKKGIAASYAIPSHNQFNSREDMLIVYSDVVVQGAHSFEYPDVSWPDNNSYVHYPTAFDNQKPVVGEAWAATQRNHEVIFAENGGVYSDSAAVFWEAPTEVGHTFLGVKYKLKNNIPGEPTETISQAMIDEMTSYIELLQIKYPGLA